MPLRWMVPYIDVLYFMLNYLITITNFFDVLINDYQYFRSVNVLSWLESLKLRLVGVGHLSLAQNVRVRLRKWIDNIIVRHVLWWSRRLLGINYFVLLLFILLLSSLCGLFWKQIVLPQIGTSCPCKLWIQLGL